MFKVLFGLIVAWFFLVYVPFFGIPFPTGSGVQAGYVSAIEKQGVFFKTGRVYIKPDLSSTQEDIYCVTDEGVYRQLETASLLQERVEVRHNSVLVAGVTSCEGESAIITSVNPL